MIRHPARWRRLEVRQHAGGDQQLIGFSVKLVGTTEYVAIEKLENDLKIYLFLTYNLTLESMEVLKKNEINYLSISNFVWTDETYSKRKQI